MQGATRHPATRMGTAATSTSVDQASLVPVRFCHLAEGILTTQKRGPDALTVPFVGADPAERPDPQIGDSIRRATPAAPTHDKDDKLRLSEDWKANVSNKIRDLGDRHTGKRDDPVTEPQAALANHIRSRWHSSPHPAGSADLRQTVSRRQRQPTRALYPENRRIPSCPSATVSCVHGFIAR